MSHLHVQVLCVSPAYVYLINFSAMDHESQKRNSFDFGMLNIGQPGTDCKKTVAISLLIDLLYLWKRALWRVLAKFPLTFCEQDELQHGLPQTLTD